jgi:predicted phosphohydrolase
MTRTAEGFTYFRNLRTRLLAWYFLLAVCTTGMAVWVTRQIYCHRLDEQAAMSLAEEVERFQRSAQSIAQRPTADSVYQIFD